jgi:carboxyl-terminal processing protease
MERVIQSNEGLQDTASIGKAYKTPKGNTVYDGGGIIPNQWIPTNGVYKDTNYTALIVSGALNEFVLQYYLKNQTALNKYKSVKAFTTDYSKQDFTKAFDQYLRSTNRSGLPANLRSNVLVQNQLIAMLARYKWYKQGYTEAMNLMDQNFTAVIK